MDVQHRKKSYVFELYRMVIRDNIFVYLLLTLNAHYIRRALSLDASIVFCDFECDIFSE